MSTHTPGSPHERAVSHHGTESHGECDDIHIARLSGDDIASMSTSELVQIIRAARVPVLRKDVNCTLDTYDRPTLERLAYLTQRCCRHRLGGEDHGFHHTPWHMACADL